MKVVDSESFSDATNAAVVTVIDTDGKIATGRTVRFERSVGCVRGIRLCGISHRDGKRFQTHPAYGRDVLLIEDSGHDG